MAANAALGEAYVEIRARLDKFSADLDKARAETTRAIGDIAKQVAAAQAGFKPLEQSMAGVRAEVAALAQAQAPLATRLTATQLALGTLAGAGVATAGILVALTKGALNQAEALTVVSQRLGVSTQFLQAYGFAAQKVGIDQVKFDDALRLFSQRVGDAKTGTDELASRLRLLDPAFLQNVRSAGSVEQAFALITKKIATLPDQFQAASLAAAAFGEQGTAIATVLRQNANAFTDGAAEAKKLGIVLDDNLVDAGRRAQEALDRMLEVLRTGIAKELLNAAPLIERWAESWTRGIAAAVKGLDNLLADLGLINQTLDERLGRLLEERTRQFEELGRAQRAAATPAPVVTPGTPGVPTGVRPTPAAPGVTPGPVSTPDFGDALARRQSDTAGGLLNQQRVVAGLDEEIGKLKEKKAAQDAVNQAKKDEPKSAPVDTQEEHRIRLIEAEAQAKAKANREHLDDAHARGLVAEAIALENGASVEQAARIREATTLDAQATKERQEYNKELREGISHAKSAAAAQDRFSASIVAQAAATKAEIAIREEGIRSGRSAEEIEARVALARKLAVGESKGLADSYQDLLDKYGPLLKDQAEEEIRLNAIIDARNALRNTEDRTKSLNAETEAIQKALTAGANSEQAERAGAAAAKAASASRADEADQIRLGTAAIDEYNAALKNELATRELNASRAAEDDIRVGQQQVAVYEALAQGAIDLTEARTQLALIEANGGRAVSDEVLARQRLAIQLRNELALREQQARALTEPIARALDDVGDLAADTFEGMLEDGEVNFQKLADSLKRILFNALAEIAKAAIINPIIQPIIAQVTGVGTTGGGVAGVAGGGGGGFGGILQTGQQLLSLGSTLKSGFSFLSSALGASTAATVDLTAATGVAAESIGVASGSIDAAVFGIENAGSLAISGAAGVAPGTGALLVDATGAPLGTAGVVAGGGSAGLGLAGGAASLGVLSAVVAAVESIMGLQALQKNRDAAFSTADTRKIFMSTLDPFTLAIANFTSTVAGMGLLGGFGTTPGGGSSANNLLGLTQRLEFGGASTGDWLKSAAIFNPVNPLFGLIAPILAFGAFTKPPTRGTALRKGFEEFIEDKDLGAGFFARDSGTFKRGIGQTGLSANDVHGGDILASRRDAIGQGARGIADAKGIDFVAAQKEFIQLQKESIGLTDDQLKQVTGLGAAFRAFVGGQAGQEESRTFGVIADFLGSIAAEGADAAETMDIVATAVAGLGRPALVFQKLNDFFKSGDNDIPVETYRESIQGLAAALFQDLPQGVDAAAIALRELDKVGNGNVTFEAIEKAVKNASTEAEALGPALADAFQAGLESVNLDAFKAQLEDLNFDPIAIKAKIDSLTFDSDALAKNLADSIQAQLKDAIAGQVFDGLIKDAFTGDILGPALDSITETTKKFKAGEITQAEADAAFAQAVADAKDNAAALKPLLDSLAAAGKDLATAFDDAGNSAEALQQIIAAFNKGIAEQTLQALSPDVAAQYQLEVEARNRLAAARAAGGDIAAVEHLNGILRANLEKKQGEERLREQKRQADEQARLLKQAQEKATAALKGIKDAIDNALGSRDSPLAPRAAVAHAQSVFEDLVAKAQGGDVKAAEDLPEAFNRLLDTARGAFASGPEFAAIFNTALAEMQAILAKGPGPLTHIEPGDQAIIDAIDENSAEEQALLKALLDALPYDEHGNPKDPTGPYAPPAKGTYSSNTPEGLPAPAGGVTPNTGPTGGAHTTTGGAYGNTPTQQSAVQQMLAGLAPGGATETALRALLSVTSFAELQTLAGVASFQGKTVAAILGDYPGVHSVAGFDRIVQAMIAKIHDQTKFQPALGFAQGGITDHPAIFGENGPEAAIPLSRGRMIPIARVDLNLARLARAIRDLERPSSALGAAQDALSGLLHLELGETNRQIGLTNARLERIEYQLVGLLGAANDLARTQRKLATSDSRGSR